MGATADSAEVRFGVAITTVGRWDALRELLNDLAAQTHSPHAVAIAHHDPANASGRQGR